MITEFKIYEIHLTDTPIQPEVGNYVYIKILDIDNYGDDDEVVSITNQIGKVIEIHGGKRLCYSVLINDKQHTAFPDEIIIVGNTEDEIRMKLETDKYNL